MKKPLIFSAIALSMAAPLPAITHVTEGAAAVAHRKKHRTYRTARTETVSASRVYRGSDGRYYCRKSDGATGTVIGGVAGGVVGNVVAGRGNRLLGTVIGAGAGALIGRTIDKKTVRCR